MWYLFLLPLATALRHLEPPPPAPAAGAPRNVQEGYFNVRLNHFDASNTDVFPMRYYYNDAMANSSDIVIYVGGEWTISQSWLQAGLPYELAEHLQAGLFYTEHRYYGLTRPTNTTAVEELRYLNVDQALADLAQFIQIVQSDAFEGGRFRGGRVALVGCSYAGSMATWMRVAYPHIITAAFSDSGPLHAQEDFPEYLETITEALRVQGSEECVDTIRDAMEQVRDLLNTPAGQATVSELFNTCTTLEGSTPLDHATFFWFGITETFALLVQYATPGNIPAACNQLTSTDSSSDAMTRLASWIRGRTQPCIEARYQQQVALHTNISYDAPEATMRLWTYQTCVEYGWYQTTTGSDHPFLQTIPLEYFHQMCRDFFSSYFDENRLRAGITRSNLFFGGLTRLPDHVVSVAGSHDPWSPMGPNSTHAHALAPVYVVPGISHCRTVQSTSSQANNEELARTKRAVLNHLHTWMAGEPLFNETDAASGIVPSLFLLIAALAMVVA